MMPKNAEVVVAETQAVAPSNMLEVIAAALKDPRIDPDRLGKLLDFQERVDAREAEKEFWHNFALASKDMPRVRKDGTIDMGGKGSMKFAKYEDIDKAVKPIENKYGFTRMFMTEPDQNGVRMVVKLAHCGGHKETSTLLMPPDTGAGRNAMQARGSAASYCKRYLTLDIWNIVTEGQDNDASGAEPLNEQELSNVTSMIDACELNAAEVKAFLKFAKADIIERIQRHRYEEVMQALRGKLARKRADQ